MGSCKINKGWCAVLALKSLVLWCSHSALPTGGQHLVDALLFDDKLMMIIEWVYIYIKSVIWFGYEGCKCIKYESGHTTRPKCGSG